MRNLLHLPLARTYQLIMAARNYFYDHNWLPIYPAQLSVVSVGNLTVGGTGKTPFTIFLLEALLERQIRPAVISRGYRGQARGVQRVLPERLDAGRFFGDEPTLIARRFMQVPVFTGTDKVRVSQAVKQETNAQLIIADDAFQHRRLRRDLDIVLIDATEPRANYRQMPLGRAREGWSSLGRAQAIVVTKANLISPEDLAQLQRDLKQAAPQALHFAMKSEISRIRHGQEVFTVSEMSEMSEMSERVLVVAGIAQPQSLLQLTEGLERVGELFYPDHHDYSAKDLQNIEALARAQGATAVLMTEKDFVKLSEWQPRHLKILVTQLSFVPLTPMDRLYEKLGRLCL